MIFFAHPRLLTLLAIPAVLVFWEWVRKGQPVVVPVDFRTKSRGHFLRFCIQAANMLPACLLAAAIVLLARPMKNLPPEVERRLSNIQIVLDTSPSIKEPFGPQPGDGTIYRVFDAEMEAIGNFLKYRRGDAFGLTIYAEPYLHWIPLTQDTSAIELAKPFIRPVGSGPPGREWTTGFPTFWGTATFTALEGAADVLVRRAEGDRMVILLTDGGHNSEDDSMERISRIISRYKDEHITCFGIFINAGESMPPLESLFCRETGGEFFRAVDKPALDAVFKHIDKMKKAKTFTREPRAADHQAPVLKPALVILLLHLLALLGLRYTPW